MAEDLPPPAVDPAAYDDTYYLHVNMGADEWRTSSGARYGARYGGLLSLASLQPGDRILDIGTGRGEILPVALAAGASRAVGVDYSAAAVAMAQQTLDRAGSPEAAEVVLADARSIPVPSASFDLVTLLDVVEHLTPTELTATLEEALRALRPGGRVFIHTAPNALVYRWTYRVHRALVPGRSARWPADPRNDYERLMHVNELTPLALHKVMRAAGLGRVGLRLGRWVHTEFVPTARAKRVYYALSRLPGLRWLAVFDFYAEGTKPGAEAPRKRFVRHVRI